MEIEKLGKAGVISDDGMVTRVGKDGKTVAVKNADGTVQELDVAGHNPVAAAKGIGENANRTGKATAEYTEGTGKRVVQFSRTSRVPQSFEPKHGTG